MNTCANRVASLFPLVQDEQFKDMIWGQIVFFLEDICVGKPQGHHSMPTGSAHAVLKIKMLHLEEMALNIFLTVWIHKERLTSKAPFCLLYW